MWDKPKKVQTTAEWKDGYGFDGGPTGGYMPNMSDADTKQWKAKITGTKLGFPQVEIRKTAGAQMTIIVNLGAGYNYKYYKAVDPEYEGWTIADWRAKFPTLERGYTDEQITRRLFPTKGINVHLALNGPAQLTFAEMGEMQQAIEEAKLALLALDE